MNQGMVCIIDAIRNFVKDQIPPPKCGRDAMFLHMLTVDPKEGEEDPLLEEVMTTNDFIVRTGEIEPLAFYLGFAGENAYEEQLYRLVVQYLGGVEEPKATFDQTGTAPELVREYQAWELTNHWS
jgi:hypothetical protein